MRVALFFIVLILYSSVHAQVDYHKIEYKELSPCVIDTEIDSFLVIHKRYAIIYLKQSDIKEYIEQNKRARKNKFSNITELLGKEKRQHIITDWWYDYDDNYRKMKFRDINYENEDRYYLKELYYVVADLMHDGKFMIIEKGADKPILKGLCIKKKEGFYGTEYVEFLLPNGKCFWSIITAFGE